MNTTPTSPEAPDPLDALLREPEPHIPDEGFTRRVLGALPPRRRLDPLRLTLFAAAWLGGAVILLLRSPALGDTPAAFFQHARHFELAPLLALAPIVLGLGCLVWALATWALEEWA
jgi:hypothetical protein